MSIWGKVVGGLTFGVVQEVTDDDTPPVPLINSEVHPTAPTVASPASLPASYPTARSAEIEPAAAARAAKDLETVLGATPSKFHDFFEKKLEFVEVLTEAGADAGKVEAVATTKALKAVKLTLADMNAAMGAARSSLGGLKTNFADALAAERETQVIQPTQDVRRTEQEIADLRAQITRLEGQIAEKHAGIQPAQDEIAKAETNLSRAQAVFDASCGKVDSALRAMETQILQCLQSKEVTRKKGKEEA